MRLIHNLFQVALAEPGIFSTIDYSKSDSWAAATLGYEIFLGYNPFVRNERVRQLSVWDYKESDLPSLESSSVPPIFKRLLPAMLRRNTSRVSYNLFSLLLESAKSS
jgi:hypothetical protein